MQSVTSVANPLYGVPQLVSAASSTVKRTRVAIPVNQEGDYSHRQSSGRYIAQCTIGSNQDGIITENTYWEFDITPTWYDVSTQPTNTVYPRVFDEGLTPTFDQDVSSLIARMKISLPQGLVIEEINLYNQLANLLNAYIVDPIRKTQNLITLSSFSKSSFRERGQSSFIDGLFYKSPTFNCSLRHGLTTRIQLPLYLSSFMKSCKYIPLFLLRNGIQFEIEFEDPYKAFVLEHSIPTHVKWRQNDIPALAYGRMDLNSNNPSTPYHANFTFGPGPTNSVGSGTSNTREDVNFPDYATYVATNYDWPHFWAPDESVRVAGVATAPAFNAGVQSTIAPNANVSTAALNVDGDGNQLLQRCKNFLYLSERIAKPMIQARNDLAKSIRSCHVRGTDMNGDFTKRALQTTLYSGMVMGVPLVLKRDGVVMHRFWTALDFWMDGYSWGRQDAVYAAGTAGAERVELSANASDWGFLPTTTAVVNGTATERTMVHTPPLLSCLFSPSGTLASTGLVNPSNRYFGFRHQDISVAAYAGGVTILDQPRTSQFQNWNGCPELAVTLNATQANVEAMVCGNVNSLRLTAQMMLAFPCYKYNHFHPTEISNWAGHIPIFPMDIAQGFDPLSFYPDFFNSGYTLDIGVESAFLLKLVTDSTAGALNYVNNNAAQGPNSYDPAIRDMQHVINFAGKHYLQWNYTVKNIRMVVDMCQPSSDVFTEYSRAFQSRIGIPYTMNRIIMTDRSFNVGASGAQQFIIPISARSLKTIIVTFDDNYFTTFSRGTLSSMYTPFLSSFMRRGLVELKLTVGGSIKPEYTLRFDRNGGVEHIVETGSAFGVPFIQGFTPQFSKDALAPTRNYFAVGNMDNVINTLVQNWTARSFPAVGTENSTGIIRSVKNYGIDYADASKFIIAIPLVRTDKFPFASGLDSTMAGSLVLTATFELDGQPNVANESMDPGKQWNRQIHMTVRGEVDAVITLQNDLSTSRW